MKDIKLSDLRKAIADYIYSEGCSCCQSIDEHKKSGGIFAKMLKVPRYKDNSGYDWSRFRTKRKVKP